MEMIVSRDVGARDTIQHGGVYQLVSCLRDTSNPVRDAAYQVGDCGVCAHAYVCVTVCVYVCGCDCTSYAVLGCAVYLCRL